MQDLKKNIARRKRLDVLFGGIGVLMIISSMSVLGVLVADLVRDGTGRLMSRSYVREDGQPPSRLDKIGVVTREKLPDGKEAWFLIRDRIDLDMSAAGGDYAALDGKRVIVGGDPPDPGEPMEVEKVAAYPEGGGDSLPRVGRRDVIGVLTRGKVRPRRAAEGDIAAAAPLQLWALAPQKIWLDTSSFQRQDLSAYEGKRVAAMGTYKPAEGALVVSNVMRLDAKTFFNTMPSRKAEQAGIYSAWVGTCLVMLVTLVTAVPLGVGAGVYLEEYARKSWLTALIEINIANLAGVPSIIWGLMALGLFVYKFNFGHSILTAGLTLGLLVLPIVIIATRESIRAIPSGIRDASYALGATKWETVRYHILPYSMGGILTGMIVSLSRAIGETAPLITIGALTYVAFLPESPVTGDFPFVSFQWLRAPFTVMPIQMFNWISRPDPAFHQNAAAAGVVLLVMTLSMNAFAIFLRYRLRKRIKW